MSYNANSTGNIIKLTGSTSGILSMFPSAITTSYSLIWPAAQGSGSLINDGAGNLSWGSAVPTFTGIAYSNGTVFQAAIASNFPILNQNTTGTAANITGVVAIANGGTGQSTATNSFNALAPGTALGGLIYGNATNSYSNLNIGSAGQVLTVTAGIPSWTTPAATGVTSISLVVPSFLTVAPSTITSSGTFTIGLATELANTVFAGPPFGSGTTPTFRLLTDADVTFLSVTSTYAFFTGIIPGTATSVTITANSPGTNGNNIALVFTGSNTIAQEIASWNVLNPLNQATLTSGNGAQTPTSGTTTLSSGFSGGSSLVGDVSNYTNFTPTSSTIAGVFAGINTALGQRANTFLSNLTSPTAVNASVVPGVNNSINLGSSALSWANVYSYILSAHLGSPYINLTTGQIFDIANILSIDWSAGRFLYDSAGTESVGYSDRRTRDSSSVSSIDWQARQLLDNAGGVTLDWTATGGPGNSGIIISQMTPNTVPYLNASLVLVSSAVTNTELGYLSGVTSPIQTQLNALATSTLPTNDIFVGNGSNVATAVSMSGGATIVASGFVTLTNSAVTGQLLTGYISSAGTISPTDSILTAIEKLNGNDALYLPLVGGTMSGVINMGSNKITNLASGTTTGDALQWGQIGAANGIAGLDATGHVPTSQLPLTTFQFQGAWNPNTNTPMLADGTGTPGFVYYVSVADAGTVPGLTDPSMTNFMVGNLIIYNGNLAKWEQIAAATGVSSVNGSTGAVTVNAINQLTGDVTTPMASGSQSEPATIAAIQGNPVTGTTGLGNVVFSSNPTLTGTIAAGAITLSSTLVATGAISGSNLTAGGHAILDLPLTGGTLSGTLNGTSIVLSGTLAATGTISGFNLTSGGHATLDLLASNNLSDVSSAIAAFNNISPMTTPGDITYEVTANHATRLAIGTPGQILTVSGSALPVWATPATSGTVTSVGLFDGSATPIYAITNSPVTNSGTLVFTLQNQIAHSFFAGPVGGGPAQPTFRGIVTSDVPTLNQNTTGTASNVTGVVAIANGGTGQTTSTSAFNALATILSNPGDLIYELTAGIAAALPIGTSGQTLTVVSGLPSWQTVAAVNGFTYLNTGSVYGGTNSSLSFTGNENTIVGDGAGSALTSGLVNTFYGFNSGNVVTSGNGNVFIGASSNATGATVTGAIGIGYNVLAGPSSVAIGINSSSLGQSSVAIGSSSQSNALHGIAIGSSSTANYASLVIGGINAVDTAASQIVFGSATTPLNDIYFGAGTAAFIGTPPTTSIQPSGASGTDTVGSSFTISSGNGTGTGGSGSILFDIAPAGLTGTTPDVLRTALSIDKTGALNFFGSTSGEISFKTQAVAGTYNFNLPTTAGTAGQVLTSQGGGSTALTWTTPSSPGTGTVTSVALAAPSIFTVSGSPVTTSGTLTFSLNTESANTVFAGPTTGVAAVPTFRSLVAADIPSLSGVYLPLTGGTLAGVLNMGGNEITGLPIPTATGEPLTWDQLASPNGVATLDGSGKIPVGQLPSVVMEYQQAWNPNTNTPALADGIGTNGYVYRVSTLDLGTVAGLTDPSMTNFQIGNLIIYSGTLGKWQQAPSADGVTFVNGAQGAVTVNAINQLTGDVTTTAASGSQSKVASLVATTNATLVTLSALTTANALTSATSLTTLPSLSLPYSQVTGTPTPLIFADSLVNTSGTVTLKNDTASPSASQYYGTNGSSTLGYYNLPVSSGGTVTSVSVVSINGFAGSVANPTTTPAITLSTTLTTPVVAANGTAFIAGTTTGTGSTVVLQTSPTLIMPNLGTPSSLDLTNATNLPLSSGVSGVLPYNFGGTGQSGLWTTGEVVYAAGSTVLANTTGGSTGQVLTYQSAAAPIWTTPTTGSVTSVSVVSANGLSGTVATATTTPAITLSPTFTGIAYSTGTAFQAAVAANFPTLNQNTTGTASNITASTNSTLTTLTALSLPYSQVTGTPTPLIFADSLVNTSGTVTLVNDTASPTASQYYGTNASSTLGYYALPVSNGFVYSSANTSVYGGTFSTLTITGANNTVVGVGAGNSLTSGANNTFYGYQSGGACIGGKGNTAIGYQALLVSVTSPTGTGKANTAVGFQALVATTSGIGNTAIGYATLAANIIGGQNTAIGQGALGSANTSGNTAIGYNALSTTTGSQNVGIGGSVVISGASSSNVVIGNAAQITTGGSNSVVIGSGTVSSGVGSVLVGTGLFDSGGSYSISLGQAAGGAGGAVCTFGTTTDQAAQVVTTASGQITFGTGKADAVPLTDMFIGCGAVGDGVTAAVTIQPTPIDGGNSGSFTNVTGGSLTLLAGNGTGTGGSGPISFNIASPGVSGTAQNTYTQALSIDNTGSVNYFGSTSGEISFKTQAVAGTYNFNLPTTAGTIGQVLTSQGGGSTAMTWTSGGGVSSVGFADTSTAPIYTITNSPITSSGTIDQTLIVQSANTVFAGPTTGSAAQPTFRSIVSADIPTLNQNTTGTASNITATSNSTLTTLTALSLPTSQLTGTISGSSITGGTFGAVNGSALTNLSAANISGVLPIGVTGGSGLSIATTQLTGTVSLTTQVSGVLPYNFGGTGQSGLWTTGEVVYAAGSTVLANTTGGSTGQVLTYQSAAAPIWTTPTTGSVTSVSLAAPSIFTVSGSPVTTTGTLTFTLNSESANTFLAAPNGSAGVPTFRIIAAADVPTLNQNTTGTASNVTGIVAVANGGTGDSSFTAYAPIAGGTTTTGPLQSLSTGMSTSGFVLTSTGTSSAPTWQAVASSSGFTYPTSGSAVGGENGNGPAAMTGQQNTAVGQFAGAALTSGIRNTFYGYQSGKADTTGTDNVGIGSNALLGNIISSQNIAIGSSALTGVLASGSNGHTAVGYNALSVSTATTLPNTAVGWSSLAANTTGWGNTALGYSTLLANTTGMENVAIGHGAMSAGTATTSCVAIGYNALQNGGSSSVAIGMNTYTGGSGSNCVAIGFEALQQNTGSSNTGVGIQALLNSTGSNNSALGAFALQSITSGNNNIGIGMGSGNADTATTNTFYVGSTAHPINTIQVDSNVTAGASFNNPMQFGANVTHNAGINFHRTAITTTYTVLASDYLVAITSTAAAFSITLPAATTVGKTIIIKDESGTAATNALTIVGTIDGVTNYIISENYGSVTVYSNGTAWFITGYA